MAFLTEEDKIPIILTRGTTQKFRIGFFTDGSKTTPLIPKNPLLYPSYEIADLNGVVVQSGVMQQDGGPGEYSASWTIPLDAVVSNPNQRYTFKTFIITNANEQAELTHQFDVVDTRITATEDRSQSILVLSGTEVELTIRSTTKIDLDNFGSLELQVVLGNTATNDFVPIGPGGSKKVTLANGEIREITNGDSFIYAYTVPEGLLQNSCQ